MLKSKAKTAKTNTTYHTLKEREEKLPDTQLLWVFPPLYYYKNTCKILPKYKISQWKGIKKKRKRRK